MNQTIIDAIRANTDKNNTGTIYSFLGKENKVVKRHSFQSLYLNICSFSSWLTSYKLQGRPVAILISDRQLFIEIFLACLASGVIAIPLSVPHRRKPMLGLKAILKNAGVCSIVGQAEVLERIKEDSSLRGLNLLNPDEVNSEAECQFDMPTIDSNSIAFIQYTSGSTGTPKGVMVSHNNLLKNEAVIQAAMGITSESVVVNWLPLFHDMGLIGGMLQPLYSGAHCVVLDPLSFLQKPARWLQAVTEFGATVTGGPNFAYDLCARRISEEDCAKLDLSSLKVAFCGSEPVRANTIKAFNKKFIACGFSSSAFFPCYGMAEHTLYISGVGEGGGPSSTAVNQTKLQEKTIVLADGAMDKDSVEVVSCGKVPQQIQVKIVDPESQATLPENDIGEIWVSSESVARGYWNDESLTESVFKATIRGDDSNTQYLRTGDLGFLRNNELYVCGRLKEVIIVRGRNYYPRDIEFLVEQVNEALVPSGGAAFSIERDCQEILVIVQEVARTAFKTLDNTKLILDIRQAISEAFSLSLADCVLVKQGLVPRTTSGKIKRNLCRQMYLNGDFNQDGLGSLKPVSSFQGGELTARRLHEC